MQTFLEALYSDLPPGAWVYLWTLSPEGDKLSTWFQQVREAANHAASLRGVNVYYPIAWTNQRNSSHNRMEQQHVAGIIALVSDVDLKDTAHPRAPETQEEALALIAAFPLQPTAIIHSGHGLQCLWLFREPWAFGSDQERQEARDLSKAWAYTLAAIASRKSFELDAVHDLTRVMRLPGTTNIKDPARPCPVVLLSHDDLLRYNPPDFEPYLAEVGPVNLLRDLPTIDLSATFPLQKHEALCDADPDYLATWRHERTFPRDNSCSAFDMALASRAVQANWLDNEIAAVLRENQRRHGNKPEKVNDARYYARTIAKAHEGTTKESAQAEAVAILSDEDAGRQEAIDALAVRWQIPLTNIQIVTGDPAVFLFWIAGRCAEIGAPDMVTQQRFLGEMISVAQVYPVPVGQKEKPGWRDYVNTICRIAEKVEVGDDATRKGSFAALMRDFLEERGIEVCEEGTLLRYNIGPFERAGLVWVRLRDLLQFLRVHDTRNTRATVAQKLRGLGAVSKPHKTAGRSKGKDTTARFYGLRISIWEADEKSPAEHDMSVTE